ncbi:MAG: exodeoxyribonuclease V subunit gamma [Nocardioides sp.]
MALHLHRASRTDLLADGLAELLAESPAGGQRDPFGSEVVVVPARGVERWLAQRLSHRIGAGPRGGDGVCAGIRFLSPHSLTAMLLRREADDPWAPARLVWPLLDVIDGSLDEPWCRALARHLGHGRVGEDGEIRRGRRYAVALRLARLFASYAGQRPALIAAWRENPGGAGDTDGRGEPLADDLAWQAELWRRLVERIDEPPPDLRLERTVAALRAGEEIADLPGRLSLFGHTRIGSGDAELLSGLAARRDVHLWLPQASPALWTALATSRPPGPVRRADDRSAEKVRHPLLASLGRDARELHRTIASRVDDDSMVDPRSGSPSERPAARTLLGWLQSDIRGDTRPSRDLAAQRTIAPDDRSVQVHACHGPSRQIDVLREVLVGLLEDDLSLQPRDIVVMCPDVETFAPLIQAGFGLADIAADAFDSDGLVDRLPGEPRHLTHPAHRLRVSVADRSLLTTNPLLRVATALVELAGGRVTASEVADLLAVDPVRLRFRLGDDDLARIEGWIADSGVRWGLDAARRAAYSMQGFGHNTWRSGLDRILAGVAMSGDDLGHIGSALPLDDVSSNDVELVGRLAEAAERIEHCLGRLHRAREAAEWLDALSEGVRSLTAVPATDRWQVAQFDREFAEACAAAGAGSRLAPRLLLSDVRAILRSMTEARPTRANFRTGTLSVCTLVPMRSVPHRVVCLVGLDDGLFPRVGAGDGDDVLARDPVTGERDVRSEDRQLLLDAIMAAEQTLVICYSGADEHTGAARPPAVPVDEIIDAVSRTAGHDHRSTRSRIVTRHPLQAHDWHNFVGGGPADPSEAATTGRVDGYYGTGRPFSFDRAAEAGARAAAGVRRPPAPLLPRPLPATPAGGSGEVDLARLKAFFAHPVRSFLKDRLQLSVPLEHDELDDAIPTQLNALQKWDAGDRLLRGVVAGRDPVALMTAEQLRGTLPPGRLGELDLETVTREVQALVTATALLREDRRRVLDGAVRLPDGRLLTGTLPHVFGNRLVSVGYSAVRARQRLQAWIDLLFASAAFPDHNWTAHTVGKSRGAPVRALAGPLDDRALGWLADLVALYDDGHRTLVPAPVKTACAWAEAHFQSGLGSDRSPAAAAAGQWETDPNNQYGIQGEHADAWHRRAYGDGSRVGVLLEAGLPDVATRIWEPVLSGQERVGPLS